MRRQEISAQARRFVTAAIVAAVATPAVVTVAAAPAPAAPPALARTWGDLMFQSLTVTATGAQLRQTLAAQRTTVTTRTTEVNRATAAVTAAQKALPIHAANDTSAKIRLATAGRVLSAAKKNLAAIKPTNKAAVTRAQREVTAARQIYVLRTSQAQAMATALTTAKVTAATAATTLTSANAALQAASTAATATQQRIAALPTPASLSIQAAALSQDVVTAVRPAFTVADTRLVYGTTVHWNIAYSYKRMVDDAAKAKISISGGGFRTRQRQIELRKINGCPDIWTAPASSCRVPTAIPGRSLHEIGMAIDITSGGRSLTSKSPAFLWLKANAAKYGFKNLPSEPWHWSITGG